MSIKVHWSFYNDHLWFSCCYRLMFSLWLAKSYRCWTKYCQAFTTWESSIWPLFEEIQTQKKDMHQCSLDKISNEGHACSPETNVIKSFVVDDVSHVCILHQLMDGQRSVIRFYYYVRDLKRYNTQAVKAYHVTIRHFISPNVDLTKDHFARQVPYYDIFKVINPVCLLFNFVKTTASY